MKVAGEVVRSTKFCHYSDLTLASYTPNKKNKIVLVISAKIITGNIGDRDKPEVILYYYKNKGGTDVFDKLCHAYTTTYTTKRWPTQFFFDMLDQAVVISRYLYTCKYADDATKKKFAAVALKEVVAHLIEPYLKEKIKNTFMRIDI